MNNAMNENTVSAVNQLSGNPTCVFNGNKDAKLRIAILGNSITRHGPKPEIGWYGLYGMAASCIENDYVHKLCSYLEKDNIDYYMAIVQVSNWERNYTEHDFSYYKDIKDFKPDIIIFRCGENVQNLKDGDVLTESIELFVRYLSKKETKYILTSTFWESEIHEKAIFKASKDLGGEYIKLSDLGNDSTMKAYGLFEHTGVAAHPCDKGMEAIAQRIYMILKNLV